MGQRARESQSNSQVSDFGDQVEHVTSMSWGPQEKLLWGRRIMNSVMGLADLSRLWDSEVGLCSRAHSRVAASGVEGPGRAGGRALGSVSVQSIGHAVRKTDEITHGEGGEGAERARAQPSKFKEQEMEESVSNCGKIQILEA